MIIEHKVGSFIRISLICKGDSCSVVGDLPADPWCFNTGSELRVKDSVVLWSEPINVDGLRIRVCGTYVGNELKSVLFIAEGVKPSVNLENLLNKVRSFIKNECGGT